jgi:DsbC/DsbD-like thiol-disulfide interchange protein
MKMKYVFGVMVLVSAFLVCDHYTVQAQTTPPRVDIKLVLATNKVQAGRLINASLIVDIPSGYHMNAHEPISRFALPTKIEVPLPEGYKLGPISYPRAVVRKFGFSDERLGVYEKHAVIRFSLRIPAKERERTTTLKAILNYQSCSNEVCFPPRKQEATVVFKVT